MLKEMPEPLVTKIDKSNYGGRSNGFSSLFKYCHVVSLRSSSLQIKITLVGKGQLRRQNVEWKCPYCGSLPSLEKIRMRDARKLEHNLIARTKVTVAMHGINKEKLPIYHLRLRTTPDAVQAHMLSHNSRVQREIGKLEGAGEWCSLPPSGGRPSHLNSKQACL